jgi:hypothetical protein
MTRLRRMAIVLAGAMLTAGPDPVRIIGKTPQSLLSSCSAWSRAIRGFPKRGFH